MCTKLHREGGPATQWANSYKAWYKDGKLHREDGPAIEFVGGYNEYFLNNIQYEEKEYLSIIKLGIFV